MELTPHVQQLAGRLVAAAPDEASAAAVQRLLASLEPALQLQVMDILGVAALEVTEQLPGGHIELRLAGRDVQLLYVPASEAPEQSSPPPDDDGSAARITLRLPESLKAAVEDAATVAGMSTNSWLVNAIRRAIEPSGPGPRWRSGGHHFSGYAST